MSVVIHNADPTQPRETPLFEKVMKQRVHRLHGSRNLLFDEKYANRKKLWNRWTGEQINFTRKALRNMQHNRKWIRNRNENYNTNNNIYNENIRIANLNNPEWSLGVGNRANESVPKILRPNRTIRQKKRKL
jgi:hypothetical protein